MIKPRNNLNTPLHSQDKNLFSLAGDVVTLVWGLCASGDRELGTVVISLSLCSHLKEGQGKLQLSLLYASFLVLKATSVAQSGTQKL